MKSSRLWIGLLMFTLAGCGRSPLVADSPESAYRQLMMSMLLDDKKAVSELVVDPSEVNKLAEGRYPKEVEPLLAEQYRTMEIFRSDNHTVDRVELNSSAFPLPLTAIKIGDSWKIDASPLVNARQASEAIKKATQ